MTTKIVGDSIPLPKTLAKKWQGKSVRIEEIAGSLIVKITAPRSLKEILPLTRKIGRQITRRDIDEAIRKVRQEKADRR